MYVRIDYGDGMYSVCEARSEPFEDAVYMQDGVFRAFEALQDQITVFQRILQDLDEKAQKTVEGK